ncbi:hypothetical protein [Chitinophaga sp. 212800010-3]|uniref:hypothetical protein n=1 Tax=unclassified Chitinophaga TaxID=2619133 RepID=UPI002DE610A3|nr:hypothetical protein [Chitinophaga sp. 212800010-3]
MKYKLLLSLAFPLAVLTSGCYKASMTDLNKADAASHSTQSAKMLLSAPSVPVTSVQASTALWPVSALNDGNTATIWSSTPRSSANNTEWVAFWFDTFYDINTVKLNLRMNAGTALGFPVNFSVYWSNGPSWVLAATYTSYYTPQVGELLLHLPATVHANGIHIVATRLGLDDVGNYVFQLAEVGASLDNSGITPPFTSAFKIETGWDIYAPGGYRYGPSIMTHADGSIDAWFASSPTISGIWDEIDYRQSTNGGITWTADQVSLRPTPGSRDHYSVCDPGVIKFGGYYYIGYTSTEDSRGVFNHAYVARAQSPLGPWEKWNGSGWGGNPQPVVTFTGNADSWGAGEPRMVVKNDTLYFYYTWTDVGINETRVATASASNANWPASMTFRGTAINKASIAGADRCDVKYRDDLQKFQAIHTASRLSPTSYLVLWESSDGITFTKISEFHDYLKPYLHNCGWSGDELGHINPAKRQYLSYAYGPNWGAWYTAWHPINFVP